MGTINRFEDLEVWQKSRTLSRKIFETTNQGTFVKDFKLRDQINSASGSIMDDIAEGFERGGTNEFIYFLGVAKGSAGEVRSQLYRALDRKYITDEKFDELYNDVTEIARMLNGMIVYLRKTDIKGERYKVREMLANFKLET